MIHNYKYTLHKTDMSSLANHCTLYKRDDGNGIVAGWSKANKKQKQIVIPTHQAKYVV